MFWGFLPTGFGKSLILQLLPLVLKEIWSFIERSKIVFFTSLVSIMKEQVEELMLLGLKAFAIGAGDEEVLTECKSVGEGITADLLEFVRVEH